MAEPINNATVVQERCRCLRSKGMYVETEPDPSIPFYDTGAYWCIHTQNCLGPDGQIAYMESCRPGRTCYEPV